jgi:hypothetical protein
MMPRAVNGPGSGDHLFEMDVSRVLTCQIGWTSAPVVIHLVLIVRAELSSLVLFIDELTAHLGFGGSNEHRLSKRTKIHRP